MICSKFSRITVTEWAIEILDAIDIVFCLTCLFYHPFDLKRLLFSWNLCFKNSSMEVTHGLSLIVSEYERGPIYVSKTKSKVVDRSSRQ